MGNSESQYSVQESRSNGFLHPGRQKPYSLKLRSAKEEVLSPHGWWRAGSAVAGFKTRAMSRGCFSQPKSNQSYMSRHYDLVTKGREGKRSAGSLQNGLSERLRSKGHVMLPSENGCYKSLRQNGDTSCSTSDCNGQSVNGHRTPERKPRLEEPVEQNSPRVVIKSDGSVRVEFNSFSSSSMLPDEHAGPVQLLKFSPTLDSTASLSAVTHRSESDREATRNSKGSSLSSEGSWYDSPWGAGAELNDGDGTPLYRVSETPPTVNMKFLDPHLPSIAVTDLYRDRSMAATFPAAKNLHFSNDVPFKHRSSFLSVLEEPAEEECPGAKQYSSYTLPCRKSKPIAENTGKKESLRNPMRRLSDWTGSLTRKKKKKKEPRYKEPIDCFDSGVDGLTADTSSPSQVSSLVWYPKGQSRARSQSQAPPTRSDSAGALHLDMGALRQNIYENFMRELETGHTGAGSGGEEHSAEESESSSQETLGSLEQLDLLFEKEQGVVRKAGWLFFKPLLTLHKDRKLELVGRRKWKQYWVTLKGCTLLFYDTYAKGSSEQEMVPCYALLAEDSIVQAVPEHPKKENVFCLSNAYGDVYLFQASSQTDLENWVTALHSASASLFAKRHGKEDTLRLLRGQIRALLQKIDMDGKMKKMAELQLSVVSDPKNRKAIENQIQQWDQNLESFNIDLFRMRCYLASLQGGELPNPKSLLATASRPSKATLGRLGIFSVSSFHALICSRDEATMRKRSLSLSQQGRSRRGVFSSLKGLDSLTKRGREKRPSASQVPPSGQSDVYSVAPPEGKDWDSGLETPTSVYMPDYQAVPVLLKGQHTVMDVLTMVCKVVHQSVHLQFTLVRGLCFYRVGVWVCFIATHMASHVPLSCLSGFAVTGHVDSLHSSRIVVSEVLPDGVAFREGLRPGDEILVLNGCEVSSLDLAHIQTRFSEQTLHLTVRRNPPSYGLPDPAGTALLTWLVTRDQKHRLPDTSLNEITHAEASHYTPNNVWNGPHSQRPLHREIAHGHLVGSVSCGSQSVEAVCTLYRSFQEDSEGLMEDRKGSAVPEAALLRPCPRHMSVTERLRKVIQELVDTEKSYVKDLASLFEIYLKPLQKETFLTQDEMESLFGSLPEMLDFQKVFLQTLEERIASSPDFSTLETPVQFKKLLFSLGGSFLYYADHFKLYSGFCANHIKVQKVLERAKTDRAFKEFLDARNPTKQHSSTLESYLIKPVQRVLKYPLLLRELVSLTDTDSEEHYHLTEALKAMEKVASHINEMQKIYDDYGAVFDQVVAEHSGPEKEVTEISMGEFLMHSSVIWLNPFQSLGRMKKEPELTVFVFKKAVILVYRENKLKKKMVSNVPRAAHSQGDQDPFKFRWLIPLSALQVRLGNTAGKSTETNCIWELIHTKSEAEGRPEMVFHLCSSMPECKINIVKVIRSLLRETARRGMRKSERSAEKTCKGRFTPVRSAVPSSARLGSSRASWLCSKTVDVHSLAQSNRLKPPLLDSDSASESSGAPSGGAPPPDPPSNSLPAPLTQPALGHDNTKESHVLSDDDDGGFSECLDPDPETDPPDKRRAHPPLQRAHFCPVRRKVGGGDSSLRRRQGTLVNMRQHSRSLDSQSESALAGMDLTAVLEREFSVQSLTSVVNEDCFFDASSQLKS
uniref:TIAM Rac1 associated GEF 2a n=1 Tax=Electrophorus electricus TaxID=8005 RepID=A0A4W4ELV1_ELEEL